MSAFPSASAADGSASGSSSGSASAPVTFTISGDHPAPVVRVVCKFLAGHPLTLEEILLCKQALDAQVINAPAPVPAIAQAAASNDATNGEEEEEGNDDTNDTNDNNNYNYNYHCPCGFQAQNREHLKSHRKYKHLGLHCFLCGVEHETEEELSSHFTSHELAAQIDNHWRCNWPGVGSEPECPKTFTSRFAAQRCARRHQHWLSERN
ncbi:hypothetical protein HD806DRAFT_536821 [Xylariaceae sp. AK1471]|nr:hypothetical protein HD806DRAFT_536821 [Xylariaceae sp. AK1471]